MFQFNTRNRLFKILCWRGKLQSNYSFFCFVFHDIKSFAFFKWYIYICLFLLQCRIIAFQRVVSQEACSKNLETLPVIRQLDSLEIIFIILLFSLPVFPVLFWGREMLCFPSHSSYRQNEWINFFSLARVSWYINFHIHDSWSLLSFTINCQKHV